MSERDSGLRLNGQRLWSLLLDRVLLYTRAKVLRGGPPPQPAERHGGLMLGGQNALTEAEARTWARSGETVLIDPARYETHFATEEEPFHLPPELPEQLELLPQDRTLAGYLQRQRASSGLWLALTPTGYFAPGARRAVRAAVRQVKYETDEESTVLSLPLDRRWLTDETAVDFLIRELGSLVSLKAFVLGADRNPLERVGTARALRLLLSEVPGAALIRTDLAGLDAVAHGAVFAAIGTRSSLRHARPPRNGGFPPPGRPAYVLHPRLMRFMRNSTLIEKYGARAAPTCGCTYCEGRPLTRFQDTEKGAAEAELHNIAVRTPWDARILEPASETQRQAVWRQMCVEALADYSDLNRELGYEAFTPDPALETWAGVR
ncbi:hypothetical protein [Streptomyces marispadix]|uniref:Uncharacterized protein n=1 Tax=Streptomyces marispadix TaxID=2922868 RepID=A0ABS9T5I5_9ACTN|nr:hypothetical protein [Streptomyces marispadix]MCH6163794.1 hypothetical protein [Streptomyces marispadix]